LDCKCEVIAQKKLKKFTDAEAFKSLEELCIQLEKYITKHNDNTRKRKLNEETSRKSRSFYITEAFLHKCLERCLKEDSFYCKTSLIYLMENQFITTALQGILVQCYEKYNDIKLLQMIASHVKLKNALVVTLLQKVMSKLTAEETDKLLNTYKMLDYCPINPEILEQILTILTMSSNVGSMKEQLKLLSSNESIMLVQLLHYILYEVSNALIHNSDFPLDVPKVSEKQVRYYIFLLFSSENELFSSQGAKTGK